MKRWMAVAVMVAAAGWMGSARAADDGNHQLGVGAHYWKALDNIDLKDVDEDGVSWYAEYQYRPGWVGLGVDLEWMDKGFGGAPKSVYEPEGYLILGKGLYGAAGIGGYYTDGDWADKPFYFFRAGFDIELVPHFHLDLNANYRFENWDDLSAEGKEISTDTVTVGAALRVAF